jgi:hypothetical protein
MTPSSLAMLSLHNLLAMCEQKSAIAGNDCRPTRVPHAPAEPLPSVDRLLRAWLCKGSLTVPACPASNGQNDRSAKADSCTSALPLRLSGRRLRRPLPSAARRAPREDATRDSAARVDNLFHFLSIRIMRGNPTRKNQPINEIKSGGVLAPSGLMVTSPIHSGNQIRASGISKTMPSVRANGPRSKIPRHKYTTVTSTLTALDRTSHLDIRVSRNCLPTPPNGLVTPSVCQLEKLGAKAPTWSVGTLQS